MTSSPASQLFGGVPLSPFLDAAGRLALLLFNVVRCLLNRFYRTQFHMSYFLSVGRTRTINPQILRKYNYLLS